MSIVLDGAQCPPTVSVVPRRVACLDPREEMSLRIPRLFQPLITWLTAKPSAVEPYAVRTATYHLVTACLMLAGGVALSAAALTLSNGLGRAGLLTLGWIATASGMGKLQAVIYHHCAHGTVFRSHAANRWVGRAIGILLMVKQFDLYQKEHMLHHSPKKLLTDDDEFAQFVFKLCGLQCGLPKRRLWRQVLLGFVSPFFHLRFLKARASSNLFSRPLSHNAMALGYWLALLSAVHFAGLWPDFVIVWLVPLIVLFQLATALRVLCEHRFPDPSVMASRDKRFVGMATAGVFAGAPPPAASAATLEGFLEWTRWWTMMLTVHLFERLFILVGDAPAHDYHHRRPASRKWASYIHEREADRRAGCPGYPVNYIENWGLFRAIDENLASMSAAQKRTP